MEHRELIVARREAIMASRESIMAEREAAMAARETAIIEHERTTAERGRAITLRESNIARREYRMADPERTVAEYKRVMAIREQSISERERTMVEQMAPTKREERITIREAALSLRESNVFGTMKRAAAAEHYRVKMLHLGKHDPTLASLVDTVIARDRNQTLTIATLSEQLNNRTARNTQPPANLLSLPPELRLYIYRLVMTSSDVCRYTTYTTGTSHTNELVTNDETHVVTGVRQRRYGNGPQYWIIKDFQPVLARMCKMVRKEILPLFYAESTFVRNMDTTADYTRSLLNTWQRGLGEYAVDLRRITLFRTLKYHEHHHGDGLFMIAKMTLTPQGMILIDCQVSETSCFGQTLGKVEQYCACGLDRIARASIGQGVDGRRLIGLAQACVSDTYPYVAAVNCYKCGLRFVDITPSSAIKTQGPS
ncbi:hypothetical protein LTR22_003242 [Elasticomyces elasticus]|nr:hypothetical protein LTR22_003242 [Elasticomyces elasticus]KAK4929395.1 hypothetical protein LTR49_003999 [Elasticomyces elasticus]